MDEAIKQIRRIIESGRAFSKRGLLYEGAYRYGQASALINQLYMLHGKELLKLEPAAQQFLARLHEQTAILAESLGRSAGNGRHKIGDANADARESLHSVLVMLQDDIEGIDWFGS